MEIENNKPNNIQLNLVGVECNKETRQLIALAIGAALNLDGIYPAEWLDVEERNEMEDIQIGSGNNWWLKTREDGGNLVLQMRHDPKKWLETKSVSPTNMVMAYHIYRIVKSIWSITGISVELPWSSKDIVLGFYKA